MGNCVEVLCRAEEKTEAERERSEKEKAGERMRIKVVMTKEELQWLMQQIQNDTEGKKGLQQLLTEIDQRGRTRSIITTELVSVVHHHHLNSISSWKPSLECIMECPEVPDQMQR